MSSSHPLAAGDQDPLSFRHPSPGCEDDDDSWSPPVLPGDHMPGRHPSKSSQQNTSKSPLETPLDPLLNTLPSASHSAEAQGDESATFGQRGTWGTRGNTDTRSGLKQYGADERQLEAQGAVIAEPGAVPPPFWASGSRGPSGGHTQQGAGLSTKAVDGPRRTLAMVHRLQAHNYYAPTFCDACSQLLIGIMQQGIQCEVCHMNLHPECGNTPCSMEHRCRPPGDVRISAGVEDSQLDALGLKPGGSSTSILESGGIAEVLARSRSAGAGAGRQGAPLKDPLESEWHKTLMRDKQLWVPDSVALGCMVCSTSFNIVIRRHHCRRCGTCMCAWCSHMTVSDKVLSVNQNTGMIVSLSSPTPVRCCTPCTRILDQQLKNALQQRRGWGMKQRLAASAAAAPVVGDDHVAPSPSSRPGLQNGDGMSYASVERFAKTSGAESSTDVIGGGASGTTRGDLLENGTDDPIFRTSGAQAVYKNGSGLAQDQEKPPSAVPAWLGQGSMSSRRRSGSPSSDRNATDRYGGSGASAATITGGKSEPALAFSANLHTPTAVHGEAESDEGDVFGSGGGVFDPNLPPTNAESAATSEGQEDDVLDWLNAGSVV